MSFIKEFWEFLKVRKKYWLLPIIIAILLFGGLIILSQGSFGNIYSFYLLYNWDYTNSMNQLILISRHGSFYINLNNIKGTSSNIDCYQEISDL